MEIKESNVLAAYKTADESGKQMLRAMFPDMEWNERQNDNRPVTERIKTFEDACAALGEDHLYVQMFRDIFNKSEKAGANVNSDVVAYLKLRIITAALNEGWKPQFTQEEDRWFPWHFLYTDEELAEKSEEWKRDRCLTTMQHHRGEWAGLAYAKASYVSHSYSIESASSRLCFKSDTLAKYAGEQFIDLWMDFCLIPK